MKSIKFLLNQDWANKFFEKNIPTYFKGFKFVSCEIKPIKIYLNYKSVVISYHLKIEENNKLFDKIIIAKSEKGKESKGIRNDYLSTKFLIESGLKNIVPNSIDYISSYNIYLYEYLDGYFLQKLSMQKKDEEFLSFIPKIIKEIKKVHKINRINNTIKIRDKKEEKNLLKRDIKLVKKYYPKIIKEIENWIKEITYYREKNNNLFDINCYTMTHGDFYSRNILIYKKKIKLIDFSDGCFFNPLNDIGNFLINTELMLEYDFPKKYTLLIDKIRNIFIKDYFNKNIKKEEESKIDYFILLNLIRIIAFVSVSEGVKDKKQNSSLIKKLIKIGKEKNKKLISYKK